MEKKKEKKFVFVISHENIMILKGGFNKKKGKFIFEITNASNSMKELASHNSLTPTVMVLP